MAILHFETLVQAPSRRSGGESVAVAIIMAGSRHSIVLCHHAYN